MRVKLPGVVWRLLIVAAVFVGLFLVWRVIDDHWIYSGDAYVYAHEIDVAPQVSGPIVRVMVVDNQHVDAGTPLFEVYAQPYLDRVDEARAALGHSIAEEKRLAEALIVAQTAIDVAHARLAVAARQFERYKILVEANAVPRDQYDEVALKADVARSELAKVLADLRSANASLEAQRAETDADRAHLATAEFYARQTVVRSPVNGRIVHLRMWAGNYVEVGRPAIGLVEESPYSWVEANLTETDLRFVHPGMKVSVYLDMYPLHAFDGTIDSITRAVSRTPGDIKLIPYVSPIQDWIRFSRRYPVLITFNTDADHPLFAGSNARVVIHR